MNKLLVVCLISMLSISVGHSQINRDLAKTTFAQDAINSKLLESDIQSFRITSDHVSSTSSIHHFYFMQEYQGIGIYNAVGSAHFDRSEKLIQTHSAFESKINLRINATAATLTHVEAIAAAGRELKYEFEDEFELLENIGEKEQKQIYRNRTISLEDIRVRLMYQPMPNGEIRLAYDLSLLETSENNWWSIRVDALTGEILHKNNWMVSCSFDHDHSQEGHTHAATCNHADNKRSASSANTPSSSYNVYAMPLQSPADGDRTIEADPFDPTASPFGWHDTNAVSGAEFTITRGNNAHAYDDGDNAGFSPDGGAGLNFDFSIDTVYSAANPSEEAAITNLFYWNNIIHDLWYHYGFDEDAGNFQENNYGNPGLGNDYVLAEAQDGSGSCNANMGTPDDGSNPRMQMYVCNARDGDLDNLVIVHEYAHGISNRLTGGRNNTSCLSNSEQMGEGWSDYYGLMMTIQAGDLGTDAQGVGTWLFGEPISGPGIRPFPYSTDMSVNPHTYADISGVSVPHGVGSVWCMMLWEMTWALIDEYGFDSDLYFGTGGNNIAMQLVNEGMKLQPCNPGFVDGRDAILLADMNLYGGANQCLIWEAFAKRGLGFSADQGSTGSVTDGSEAFDVPGGFQFEKTVDKLIAGPSDTLMYTIKAKNSEFCNDTVMNVLIFDTIPANTFYVTSSATNGGTESGGVVTYPVIPAMYPGDSIEYSFKVYVDPAYTLIPDFTDKMESGTGNWTTSATGANDWSLDMTNPYSGFNAWFAPDVTPEQDQYLQLNTTLTPSNTTVLSFWHNYDTEATWDGGVVQYSTDGGTTWTSLGDYMVQNGYNSTIDGSGANSQPGFSGNSGGYIETIIDLAAFAGQNVDIRFWMSCDNAVSGNGWFIDDVAVKSNLIYNTVYAETAGGTFSASIENPTEIQVLQCINGVMDGDETGIDCGGTFCPPCPTCTDGIQNGDETGVDCGGLDCPTCPTCTDGIMNGLEEGVDCGGPECPPCPCMENDLTFILTLDDYPQETSWALEDSLGNVVFSGGTYPSVPDGTTLTFDFCVPDGCYELFIYDSFGDGICCVYGDGEYFLINNNTSDTLAQGGDFDDVDSTDFCLVAPPLTGCDSLLELHGIIAADVYHAADILRADGTIQSPDSTTFKAGNYIELEEDFTVELGAIFSADIETCMSAINLIKKQKAKLEGLKSEQKVKTE